MGTDKTICCHFFLSFCVWVIELFLPLPLYYFWFLSHCHTFIFFSSCCLFLSTFFSALFCIAFITKKVAFFVYLLNVHLSSWNQNTEAKNYGMCLVITVMVIIFCGRPTLLMLLNLYCNSFYVEFVGKYFNCISLDLRY